MYKRLVAAVLIVFSLSFSAGAEEITPTEKESGGFGSLKSIGSALDTLKNVLLTAPIDESEDIYAEYVSEDEIIYPDDDEEIPYSDEIPYPDDDEDTSPVKQSDLIDRTSEIDTPVYSDDVQPVSKDTPILSNDEKPASGDEKIVIDDIPLPPVSDREFRIMCESADAIIVRNAVEKRNADVNYADSYGVTPLMYAAKSNPSPEIIAILTEAGADINAQDQGGKTALMYSAESNPNPEIISALAAKGAGINARDSRRRTALMFAARMNNPDVVKALIDAGAEEIADGQGWTPLFWAARYTKYPEVIAVLLDAGHNPKARSYDMARPIEHANLNPSLINTRELARLAEESR